MQYTATHSLKSPRFSGIKTFMRMENAATTDDIDFAVVGIPYDTCASTAPTMTTPSSTMPTASPAPAATCPRSAGSSRVRPLPT